MRPTYSSPDYFSASPLTSTFLGHCYHGLNIYVNTLKPKAKWSQYCLNSQNSHKTFLFVFLFCFFDQITLNSTESRARTLSGYTAQTCAQRFLGPFSTGYAFICFVLFRFFFFFLISKPPTTNPIMVYSKTNRLHKSDHFLWAICLFLILTQEQTQPCCEYKSLINCL